MGTRERAFNELTATVVALRLRLTREQVVRRIQKGVLQGRLDPDRGWLVDRAAVADYERLALEVSATSDVA